MLHRPTNPNYPHRPSILEAHVWAILVTMLWFTVLPVSIITDRWQSRNPLLSHNLTILQYYYLPVVGAFVAIIAMNIALFIGILGFPAVVAAILGGLAIHGLNGGIHLDGLADTTDALFAHGEDRFKVMTDPHIGGLGAIYAILITLTHTTLTSTVIYEGLVSPSLRTSSLFLFTPIIVAAVSRIGCFYTLVQYYPAHHPDHMEHLFPDYHTATHFRINIIRFYLYHTAAIFFVTAFLPSAMLIVIASIIATLFVIRRWVPRLIRNLGFLYGDNLGAMILISEIFATFVSLAVIFNL